MNFRQCMLSTYITVTMASRRTMTDDEIKNFIKLWRYEPAILDSSMEMTQFYVET